MAANSEATPLIATVYGAPIQATIPAVNRLPTGVRPSTVIVYNPITRARLSSSTMVCRIELLAAMWIIRPKPAAKLVSNVSQSQVENANPIDAAPNRPQDQG